MAKRKRSKKRSAFPPAAAEKQRSRRSEQEKLPELNEQISADDYSSGIYGFFRDIGVRETFESIFVAIILALMFRAYEAEAFIIPTGSMAPSLQGQHMDLECDNCQYRYRSGASMESSASSVRANVEVTYCPICQYRTRMRPSEPDHVSNNGDRILVNKFVYDFADPERYDVIVFKNPNNGKQNYIKRLIGLPGDNILIENGDIYLMDPAEGGKWSKTIARKPSKKIRHVLQDVDDTGHIGKELVSVNWPSRWQSFGRGNWVVNPGENSSTFSSTATERTSWLHYRHFQPLKSEWATISNGSLPDRFRNGNLPAGRLIGDQYGYNDGYYRADANSINFGLHWVGDLGFKSELDVQSSSGILTLEAVEGGVHFFCDIDIATGVATLRFDKGNAVTDINFVDAGGNTVASPSAQTSISGAGKYNIDYVNADDQIHLWVNGSLVEFDAPAYTRTGVVIPHYSTDDPADAEPVGIGATNLAVEVLNLRVVRDLYYTSVKGNVRADEDRPSPLQEETNSVDWVGIGVLHMNPERWSSPDAIAMFKKKKQQTEPMFMLERGATLDQDQFLPMGDNSPRSSDGRVWDGPNYVERDMLIGRALFIYWPHTKNEPIKYFPNFERMGFIR
jgi:signal peptidase I